MAAHRYWRHRARTTYASGFFGIATVELHDSIGGSDLAAGKTCFASTSLGGYPASAAVDGNDSTFWTTGAASPPTDGHWHAVDLGTGGAADIVETVIRVRPDGFREDPNLLLLEWSDDGLNWFTVGGSTQSAWTAGEARTITFSPLAASTIQMSQSGVEVARTGVPPVLLSQSGVEIAYVPASTAARVTQAKTRVLSAGDPAARVTQVKVRVLSPLVDPITELDSTVSFDLTGSAGPITYLTPVEAEVSLSINGTGELTNLLHLEAEAGFSINGTGELSLGFDNDAQVNFSITGTGALTAGLDLSGRARISLSLFERSDNTSSFFLLF